MVAVPPTHIAPGAAQQPIALTVQLPPERPDYTGDMLSGGIGLVGGLIGALAGAYAAYLFGAKATKDAKDREGREREAHLTFAVIHKLNKIYSAQKEVRKSVQAGVDRLEAVRVDAARRRMGFVDHLSLEVRPFSTPLSAVSFTADEVAAVGRVGGQGVMKIMMMLDDRHNTTVGLLDAYRGQKAEFEGMTRSDADFDPERGYLQIRWTEEAYQKLRPHLFKMDVSVKALLAHSTEDEKSAYDAIVGILTARAKKEGVKADYRVTTPDGRTAKITSTGLEVIDGDGGPQRGAEA
ncbi:hypothetical protein D3C87_1218520 [compost metagenome]